MDADTAATHGHHWAYTPAKPSGFQIVHNTIDPAAFKMKKNFTIKRTAELLGVSLKTICRMITDGDIIAFKVRGCLRVTEESLDYYRTRQIIAYQESNGIDPKK